MSSEYRLNLIPRRGRGTPLRKSHGCSTLTEKLELSNYRDQAGCWSTLIYPWKIPLLTYYLRLEFLIYTAKWEGKHPRPRQTMCQLKWKHPTQFLLKMRFCPQLSSQKHCCDEFWWFSDESNLMLENPWRTIRSQQMKMANFRKCCFFCKLKSWSLCRLIIKVVSKNYLAEFA